MIELTVSQFIMAIGASLSLGACLGVGVLALMIAAKGA